jgi:uncharacterized membrane protein YfcA
MQRALGCPYFRRAFGWCVPIGGLGGLIGLGGGEFRLPVLMYAIGFNARSAIPLNLLTSLVTLAFSLVVRSRAVSVDALVPHLPEIAGLASGGIASAFFGARLVSRLNDKSVVSLIAALLAGIGVLMLCEASFRFEAGDLVPAGLGTHFAAGCTIGIGVGLASSILGVAGGELLIPTLVFVFGLDIKAAGSASILISLGVVMSGLWRYWRLGGIPLGAGARRITAAMAIGSLIGAGLGGFAVAYVPVTFLKVLLGCALIAAAGKTILNRQH